jgi:hypothetical protein
MKCSNLKQVKAAAGAQAYNSSRFHLLQMSLGLVRHSSHSPLFRSCVVGGHSNLALDCMYGTQIKDSLGTHYVATYYDEFSRQQP